MANNALAEALARAQAEFPAITKNCQVSYGQTKFRYADLASIIDATRPILNKHGLAISQTFSNKEGCCIITTSILHVGGGILTSDGAAFPSIGLKPQDIGSWITYWRRYALCAILGICADDDTDAVELSNRGSAGEAPGKSPRPEPPKPSQPKTSLLGQKPKPAPASEEDVPF